MLPATPCPCRKKKNPPANVWLLSAAAPVAYPLPTIWSSWVTMQLFLKKRASSAACCAMASPLIASPANACRRTWTPSCPPAWRFISTAALVMARAKFPLISCAKNSTLFTLPLALTPIKKSVFPARIPKALLVQLKCCAKSAKKECRTLRIKPL